MLLLCYCPWVNIVSADSSDREAKVASTQTKLFKMRHVCSSLVLGTKKQIPSISQSKLQVDETKRNDVVDCEGGPNKL